MTHARLLCALALLAQPLAPRGPGVAAPEAPVRLQVRKAEPPLPGRIGRALSRAARRLWEREEPSAVQGNALLAQNDVPGALGAYDESAKKLPPAGDAASALALNRAGALLKQGAEEAKLALDQAARALASTDPAMRAKAAYDGALALEAAGKTDEAIAAYGRTLALDPEDEDAKVNLELLLRGEERKKKQPSAGKQEEPKKPQEQQQQKKEGEKDPQAKGDPQKKDDPPSSAPEKDERGPQGKPAQPDDRQKGGDEKRARQDPKEPADAQGGQKPDPDKARQGAEAAAGAQGGARPLDRSDAQRLLDALRASEKSLQAWRFGKRPREPRRRGAEKDW